VEDKETKRKIDEKEEALKELDQIARMLVRRDFELMTTREEREKELRELKNVKAELEEAKDILEIKVKARTRELEEMAQGLEKQVQERTKELQDRVAELEEMNNLMIGRELRMVELKKEIESLKHENLSKKNR